MKNRLCAIAILSAAFTGCAAQRQAMGDIAVALGNGVGVAAQGYAQAYSEYQAANPPPVVVEQHGSVMTFIPSQMTITPSGTTFTGGSTEFSYY
jgi:hypothetical protein